MRYRIKQVRRVLARNPIDVVIFSFRMIKRSPRILWENLFSRFGRKIDSSDIDNRCPDTLTDLISFEPSFDTRKLAKYGKEIIEKKEIILLGERSDFEWPPDIESGEWPNKPSNSIPYYGEGIRDIKPHWEFQRLQWLVNVSAFAFETKDRKLASEILDFILFYGRMNPMYRGVNWIEGIEVSIRSISIVESLAIIKPILTDSDVRVQMIGTWLSRHAMWIEGHLSRRWRVNTNHLLLELVGITYLGSLLSWHSKSRHWSKMGIQLLNSELELQTLDGRNWEPTTSYHKFVLESCLVLYRSIRGSIEESDLERFENLVMKMVDTLDWITDSRGQIPLMGDDDAGYVIPRSRVMEARDASPVLDYAEALDLRMNPEPTGIKIWKGHGTGVIRENGLLLHFVSGAPEGKYRQSGHRHLDHLSFTLSSSLEDIVLDSGTGSYYGNRENRDLFRGSKAHSGISHTQVEWADISDLFEIKNPPVGVIEILEDGVRLSSNHPKLGKISRIIRLIGNNIEIEDLLPKGGSEVSFIVPSECSEKVRKEGFEIIGKGWSIVHGAESDNSDSIVQIESSETIFSNGYGTSGRGKRISAKYIESILAKTRISIKDK